jgi:hypothetical protein
MKYLTIKNATKKDIEEISRLYFMASTDSVGEEIICPICKTKIVKKYYHQKFCLDKCKSMFHDLVDPKRRNRAKFFANKK